VRCGCFCVLEKPLKMARPKGSRDKAPRLTAARKQAEVAAAEGITPLEVMLRVMRERWETQDKDGALAAAEKAAPYLHAKLASVDSTVKGADGGPVVFTWLPPS
jgi:hypothetical protein